MEKQQRLNRYYFQQGAPYLYKQKADGSLHHVNVGRGVCLFNTYVETNFSEYNVDYRHYVKECRDIIDKLNNHYQLTMF